MSEDNLKEWQAMRERIDMARHQASSARVDLRLRLMQWGLTSDQQREIMEAVMTISAQQWGIGWDQCAAHAIEPEDWCYECAQVGKHHRGCSKFDPDQGQPDTLKEWQGIA